MGEETCFEVFGDAGVEARRVRFALEDVGEVAWHMTGEGNLVLSGRRHVTDLRSSEPGFVGSRYAASNYVVAAFARMEPERRLG